MRSPTAIGIATLAAIFASAPMSKGSAGSSTQAMSSSSKRRQRRIVSAVVRPPLRSSMSSTSAPTAARSALTFSNAKFAKPRSIMRALTWRNPFSSGTASG